MAHLVFDSPSGLQTAKRPQFSRFQNHSPYYGMRMRVCSYTLLSQRGTLLLSSRRQGVTAPLSFYALRALRCGTKIRS